MNVRFLTCAAAAACAMLSVACAAARLTPTLAPRKIEEKITMPAETIEPGSLHDVVVVGNNWDGTATIFDPHEYTVITTIDIVPDLRTRIDEINKDRGRATIVGLNRRIAGEGNDQLVDDLFLSKDGTRLFASRPSLGDVVAFDVHTRERLWRTDVEGYRADHAALSPDGKTLLVSATRARKVHAIDTADGKIVGGFPSGDEPHESKYSDDGERIYHASIGRVFLPVRSRLLRRLKGDRWLQIIDAKSIFNRCLPPEEGKADPKDCQKTECTLRASDGSRCIDMAPSLEEFGRSGAESAVRPLAVTKDERFLYAQISFLHGFVEYDLAHDRITRIADLPASRTVKDLSAREHQLNSAHHGLALNEGDTRLCVAGTMSGYAAIVRRDTFASIIVPVGKKPYWSTESAGGTACYVSVSETNQVVVISFEDGKVLATIGVGRHPQRVRNGKMLLRPTVAVAR
jgi:DNA-binding beta-propeller fold protein YncE